jgi:uncharacterized protein YlxP (DUF503 family)
MHPEWKKCGVAHLNMNRVVTEEKQHTILRCIWCCLRFRCVACFLVVMPRKLDASLTGMQPEWKECGVAQVNMTRVVTEKQQHTILRYIWCCSRFRCVACFLVVMARQLDASLTGMQPKWKKYGVAQVNMNRVVTEKQQHTIQCYVWCCLRFRCV